MSRTKVLGLAAMVLSSTWLPTPACAAQTNDCSAETPAKFKLLTGQAGLNYNIAGRAIAEVYNKTVPPNEHLAACQSMGSIENVGALSEGKATFAIVQSDVMHSVWFGHQLFVPQDTATGCVFRAEKKPIAAGKEPLYLIAPLYAENLHILLRPHLNISNLVELKAHRVWVGSPESGSYLTAERVLGAAGLGMCDISTSDDDGRSVDTTLEALGELNSMKLDAVFFTGASGTSVIQQAFNNSKGEIHFLPLDVGLVNQLSADGSYVESMIRKRDYSNVVANAQGIPTVGVQALLIVSPNRENANVVDSFMKFFADDDNQALVRQQIRSMLTSASGGSKQQAANFAKGGAWWFFESLAIACRHTTCISRSFLSSRLLTGEDRRRPTIVLRRLCKLMVSSAARDRANLNFLAVGFCLAAQAYRTAGRGQISRSVLFRHWNGVDLDDQLVCVVGFGKACQRRLHFHW